MQFPGITLGIVADDLTGANDTCLQFFLAGCRCQILPDKTVVEIPSSELIAETDVWSLNTQSRNCTADEAVMRLQQGMQTLKETYKVDAVYKKIDSTFRGHVALECLATLESIQGVCAIVVPAFPEEGRQTIGGYLLIHGVPLERTEIARDPLFPVHLSHIPTLLKQSLPEEPVGWIPLSTVMRGAGPLLRAINEHIEHNYRLIVVDAATHEDIEQIALAIDKVRKQNRVLPCGSAGLAQALASLWAGFPEDETPHKPVDFGDADAPILMMSGSNSRITRNQIAQLTNHYGKTEDSEELFVLDLLPEHILGLDQTFKESLEEAMVHLKNGETVVIASALKVDRVQRTLALAEAENIPMEQVSKRLNDGLAQIAKAFTQAIPDLRLILTGGETAAHICHALGSKRLEILTEIQPAIPLLRDEQGRLIVTKSGGFGEPMTLLNIVRRLRQQEPLPTLMAVQKTGV